MLHSLKWLARILVAIILVAGIGAAAVYVIVTGSLPNYDQTIRVTGLDGPVEIVRNEHNIPHVLASSDPDAFFGLGFAHAQDRLWQMAINRQIVQGRLSEVFGERTLPVDRLMHSLDLYRLAGESLPYQDSYTRNALLSYSAGVNAWLEIIRQRWLVGGSPEFQIFDMELRPWTPVDSLALLSLNAFDLTPHLSEEVLRQRLLHKVPLERASDLLPMSSNIFIFGEREGSLASAAADVRSLRFEPDRGLVPEFASGSRGASNAWAVMPERTPTGGSILANDPHLGFSAPSIWMLARIELQSGGVIGATIPGVPLVMLGRTSRLAWGLTYSYLDDQDLFFEKVDPTDRNRYLTPAGYKEFENRVSVVAVEGRQPQSFTHYWTDNGPVLDASLLDIDTIQPDGHVVSLAWTWLDADNLTMSGGMRLMRSRDIDGALAAGRLIKAPSMNLFLAEKDNVAMQTVGEAPLRHSFHETLGQIPSAGWKYRNRWHGTLPYEFMPRVRNPENGYVVNTNNRLPAESFPRHISHVWGDSTRINRIVRILDDLSVHSVDSTSAAQTDIVSEAARTIIPLMARNLWHTISEDGDTPSDVQRSQALRLLQFWIGDMDEFRVEPLIYVTWTASLMKLLLQDELGPMHTEFARPDVEFINRVFLDIDGAGTWCDIVHTQPVEDCDHLARISLDHALDQLNAMLGDNMNEWRWGDVHVARHDHEVLGDTPYLSWLVNVSQGVSGGDHTLNRTTLDWSGENPFTSGDGPGYRAIYDMANPDNSRFIIATGQSGHVLSRHYDDLGTMWRVGEYIPMSLDHDEARLSAVGTTILEPAI